MTNSQRQHGIGSLAPDEKIVGKPGGIVEAGVKQYGVFKKIKKFGKKVFKSKLGKAALLGAGAYFMPGIGAKAAGGWGPWASKIGAWGKGALLGKGTGLGAAGKTMPRSGGLWNWIKNNKGQAAMLGLGTAGMIAPFLAKDEDEGEEIQDWTLPSAAIAGLWDRTRDYYKNPGNLRSSNLAFQPAKEFVNPIMYSAEGGIVGLANGGQPGNAQAEQMLKMEYQKYRNQGGTMSYQQFKMAVLQQAQGQGPMAQGQAPQMAAHGGRMGYQGGELVEDASMIEETPEGMMAENVEEVQGEPTREQLEALAMEIFQLRLEELDEEQLMVVYQAAMEQQPEAMAMQEEDIQFNPQMAQPQMAAEGGIMNLGGMEKDYRQEGGFVPLGKKEKADDVPARLSKNEFVFTADAVRNAGGGNIDKGAEVMQNMMENLESGGQISEDSQGAQGMYNNMKQLETRMI